jgi:hypothetical protein
MIMQAARATMLSAPASLLLAVLLASAGQGRDDEILVEPEAADAAGARTAHMIDLGMNFDANLFEQRGNSFVIRGSPGPAERGGDPRPVSPAIGAGQDLGRKRLERIERDCGATAEQRQRLLLAIESDVRRFAAEVEQVRGKYAGRQVNMNDPAGQREWHAFQQDIRRCRDRLRELFDEGSLFATVQNSILDQRQRERLAAESAARRSFHWRAMVLEVVAKLDDSLGLDQAQHDVIVDELLAKQPALRTDADSLDRDDANLRRNLVLMVLANTRMRPLRAALSERQWRSLSQLMNQGRAMRSWIEQQGVLEGPPP